MDDCCKVSWLGLYNNDWTRSTVITIVDKWKQFASYFWAVQFEKKSMTPHSIK